eukprot:scaffold38513_cov57-Phaeocystis_antarctica.AAC.1
MRRRETARFSTWCTMPTATRRTWRRRRRALPSRPTASRPRPTAQSRPSSSSPSTTTCSSRSGCAWPCTSWAWRGCAASCSTSRRGAHVHRMCTACAPHVHHMRTACALHVHRTCTARAMAHTTHVRQAQGRAAPRAQQLGQARRWTGAVADKLSRLGVCQRAGAAATLPRGHGARAMGPRLQP